LISEGRRSTKLRLVKIKADACTWMNGGDKVGRQGSEQEEWRHLFIEQRNKESSGRPSLKNLPYRSGKREKVEKTGWKKNELESKVQASQGTYAATGAIH